MQVFLEKNKLRPFSKIVIIIHTIVLRDGITYFVIHLAMTTLQSAASFNIHLRDDTALQ